MERSSFDEARIERLRLITIELWRKKITLEDACDEAEALAARAGRELEAAAIALRDAHDDLARAQNGIFKETVLDEAHEQGTPPVVIGGVL